MDPVLGSIVGGKYRLERALARGGMGSVWVGRHVDLDAPIAIKFMGEAGGGGLSARARFEREAKAAASLRSPHVVQVLDYDATGEMPYIVMELCEGEDLGQRLDRRGKLNLGEISEIVRQLAKGLSLAHEAGIVHRDLKPGNVFLAKVGREEIAKVLDFGVAKELRLDASDTQTTTGVVVGSPSYMSPEQARGGQIDARSDLWSLGVLVFHAVTGKRPFQGANLGDVLVKICSDAIPSARTFAPELPIAVDGFFDRALCRSPDGRFQNANEFADALATLSDSAPRGLSEARREASVSSAADAARPPDERTGSLVSPASLPSPENDAPTRIEPRAELVDGSSLASTFDPAGDSPTTATSAHSVPHSPPPRRSAAFWILASAALVPLSWFGARWLFPSESSTPAPSTQLELPEGNPSNELARTRETSLPAVGTAPMVPGEASSENLAAPPVGSLSSAVRGVAPIQSAPRYVKPRGPSTSTAIDPKFGLPTRAR